MASVSVSHLVLFVASLVIAAGVVGTVTAGVDRVSSAVQDSSLDLTQDLRTDVTIISDAGAADAAYNDTEGELTLLVKNTGTQRLPPDGSSVEVTVNGQYVNPDDVSGELVSGDGLWTRSDVLELTIGSLDLENGDHRARIIVNSDEELFRFTLTEVDG